MVEPELALREEIEDAFLQVYLFRAFLLLLLLISAITWLPEWHLALQDLQQLCPH